MNDRTNPRPARRSGVAERAAADDRTNPSRAAATSVAERSSHQRPNEPEPGGKARCRRSFRARRPNEPKTRGKARCGRARRIDDRTNPKPGAKARCRAAAPRDRAIDDRTNPRPAAEAAAPARLHYDDAYISGILQRVKTIAAVGMSANDMRPSYFAMLYLQQKGYRMIPVNPRYAGQQILGETVVASLDDLPAPPDMVQIFRKAEEAPAVVDEAIRAGAKVVWLQLGIRSDEAAAKARAAGLDVVMDRCPKIEYGRLFGEIGWAGVNRRVISAKKGQALQLSHKKGGLARRPAPRG